jgi:DNA-binding response OmpR family regulator
MRMLLIDDEPFVLEHMKFTLQKFGYHIESTTIALEAVKLYEKEKYDIVITDLNMPIMTGFDLIEKILGMDGKAVIIIISASEEKESEVLNLGAFGFLVKPFRLSELIEMLIKAENVIREAKYE